MPTRSWASALRITAQPLPTPPSTASGPAHTSSKKTSLRWWGPSIERMGRTVIPGVSMGTTNMVMPSWRCPSPTRAARTHHWAMPAYDVQIFWPSMRQPSPSGTARVRRAARSLPASGSLKPWHQMTSPAAMAGRWRRFCSSLPCAMIAGPTQLRPMYWAPRGSWWAHISSRTTVWSHSEPPPPPYSVGQAMVRRPSSARSLQNRWATSRSAGSSVKAPR